jgi:hypothetical protein
MKSPGVTAHFEAKKSPVRPELLFTMQITAFAGLLAFASVVSALPTGILGVRAGSDQDTRAIHPVVLGYKRAVTRAPLGYKRAPEPIPEPQLETANIYVVAPEEANLPDGVIIPTYGCPKGADSKKH